MDLAWPQGPQEGREELGAGPEGPLDVVLHMASPLLQDLFAVDTQKGTVTPLTAGEQGRGRGRSSSTRGYSRARIHSAPLTVPQPLLTALKTLPLQDPQPANTLPPCLCLPPLCPGTAQHSPHVAPQTHTSLSGQDQPESSS